MPISVISLRRQGSRAPDADHWHVSNQKGHHIVLILCSSPLTLPHSDLFPPKFQSVQLLDMLDLSGPE